MKENLDINRIYKKDVIVFLKEVKDNSIDLAVVDPPYNLNKWDWDTFKSEQDFFNFTFERIDNLIPKIKKNWSLYIFNTPYNSAFILNHLKKKWLIFQNWITWDKRDWFSACKTKYTNAQETILFFTKWANHTFNFEDVRIPYESTERMAHATKKWILKNGKRRFPNENWKLCPEVWHITSERHKNKINWKTIKMWHPTPKPIDMIERIIKASSNKWDLVLDCFMGTWTTAVACKKLNRNFIGCEINNEYIKIANNRLKSI